MFISGRKLPNFEENIKILIKYLEAVDEIFNFISKATKEGKPEKYLKGPIFHAGFKRLT